MIKFKKKRWLYSKFLVASTWNNKWKNLCCLCRIVANIQLLAIADDYSIPHWIFKMRIICQTYLLTHALQNTLARIWNLWIFFQIPGQAPYFLFISTKYWVSVVATFVSTLFESFLLFSTKVLSTFLVAFLLPLSPTIPANFRKHVACSQPLMSRKGKIPIKRITWSHQNVAVGFHFQQLWNFAENNWMNNLRYTSRCTYICQNDTYVYRKIFCESENVQKESVQHFTCYKEGKHRYKIPSEISTTFRKSLKIMKPHLSFLAL